jgi:hypothetical protein
VNPGELIVVTAQDPDLDYSSFATFAAPRELFDLTGTGVVPRRPAEGFEDEIVDGFRAGLLRHGWGELSDPEGPGVDALLLVGVVASESFIWIGSPGFSYYPGWGQIVPAEWPSANLPRGSVVAILVDRRAPDPEVRALPVLWSAILQSVFARGAEDVGTRLVIGLELAFAQSEYLELNAQERDASLGTGEEPDAGADGGSQ